MMCWWRKRTWIYTIYFFRMFDERPNVIYLSGPDARLVVKRLRRKKGSEK
jgi:hypothetical protein